MNCPNGIEFLSGIFIANALCVRRRFYETRAASRNRVAHNRAPEIFPKALPRAVKRGASKLGEEEPARNSTKAVFLHGDILSREYLLVPKNTSALSRFAFSNGLAQRERERESKRGRRGSLTHLNWTTALLHV